MWRLGRLTTNKVKQAQIAIPDVACYVQEKLQIGSDIL